MMADYENPGRTTIAPDVLVTIARMAALSVEGVCRMAPSRPTVSRLFRRGDLEGVDALVEDDVVYMDLYLILKQNVNVREVSRNVQQQVARTITEMIGMDVGHVNIHIEDIDYPPAAAFSSAEGRGKGDEV
jgi:uncharacterized alkaline shock family protein YloU